MPSEWTEHFDSSDRVYYYNETKGTSLTHPLENLYRDAYRTIVHFRGAMSPQDRVDELRKLQQECQQMEREVLAIQKRVLGPDNTDTLTTASNLAISVSQQGKEAEAEQMLRRSLAADPDNMLTPSYLGAMLSARGTADALAEALRLCERVVAPDKLGIIRAHASAALGIVLLRRGDAAAAREKLEEARGHCGNGYPTTLMGDLCRLLDAS